MNMDMKSTGPIPGPYTNTKRMDKGTRIIVSIGSNFNAKENITLAKIPCLPKKCGQTPSE